ncbi:hypothetical protein Hamer_G026529 [Homarus americanus]|uniref:Uncharacterized protein n=1 Tax=Homarus americanus TaxID=6706 RepID=A0A8J5JKP4_HOMAM|nr:hypothetical protein Hamer_G026529 [Homarus americanus]
MRKATDSQDEVNEINNTNDSNVEDDPASVSGNCPTLPQDPASISRTDIAQQNALSVKQLWKQFHILRVVDHMVAARNKISLATIKHAWRPLLPHPSDARSVVRKRTDLLEAVVESARSVPAPGFLYDAIEEPKHKITAGKLSPALVRTSENRRKTNQRRRSPITRHDTTRHDTTRHDTARHGTARHADTLAVHSRT